MHASPGERFARALAAKDRDGLREVLGPMIDFRGLTPRQAWEASDAEDLVDRVLLGHWFEPADEIRALVKLDGDAFADVERVAYRLEIHNPNGDFVCEQQAYYQAERGRIRWLRIVCAGFRPL